MQRTEPKQDKNCRWAHVPRAGSFEVSENAKKRSNKTYGWSFLGAEQHGNLVSVVYHNSYPGHVVTEHSAAFI